MNNARCFLSYRRQDRLAAGIVGRIYDRLIARFGNDGVFMDIDSIGLGTDFRKSIVEGVSRANVVLVLIGPEWSQIMSERAPNDTDFVRMEIESSLIQKIPVVPLLLGDTPMPAVHDLPETIREMAYLQAQRIDAGIDFNKHVIGLLDWIEAHTREIPQSDFLPSPAPPRGARVIPLSRDDDATQPIYPK